MHTTVHVCIALISDMKIKSSSPEFIPTNKHTKNVVRPLKINSLNILRVFEYFTSRFTTKLYTIFRSVSWKINVFDRTNLRFQFYEYRTNITDIV